MKFSLLIIFSTIFYLTNQAQIVNTVAGSYSDGRLAINTPIYRPEGVAIDSLGNIYIADFFNHKIKKVNINTGIITTIAGVGNAFGIGQGGNSYYSGSNNVVAITATITKPYCVKLDGSGNLYFTENYGRTIRKLNLNTGILSIIAGNGTYGFGGDGGAATAASISATDLAFDTLGNLYIADGNNHRIRKITISTGIISTVAGNGINGFGGDSVIATSTNLNSPNGIAFDAQGNLYISDCNNHRIRKVNANNGLISTIAGNGIAGFGFGNVPAISANLNYPSGIAFDSLGNLYISDFNRIQKVNVNNGIISNISGAYYPSYEGDGGNAINASLSNPTKITFDKVGNLYINDRGNNRIRKINASNGLISTIAGNGFTGFAGDSVAATAAILYGSNDICVDASANLYIADTYNHKIRKVNSGTGIITTIAGTESAGFSGDGGSANAAKLNSPNCIAIDGSRNIYIVDQLHRIRKISSSTGIISTIAGNGYYGTGGSGYYGDGVPSPTSTLNNPSGIAIDSLDNIYIADGNNHMIRKITASTGIINTIAGNGTAGYGGDGNLASLATLNYPKDLAIDRSGNIYFIDGGIRIRKIAANTGIISTVAGNPNGSENDGIAATSALLNNITTLTIDPLNNLYISTINYVRKVTASTGLISTIAGNGTFGFSGDGGSVSAASFSRIEGLAIYGVSNLFIADLYNDRIRKVNYGVFNFIATENQTICYGNSPDSLIGNTPIGGNGIYNYTWLKSTASALSGFSAIAASNSKNYKPTSLTQSTWYRRCVFSGIYTDTSAAIFVKVNPKPKSGFNINNPSQCQGTNFIFSDTSTISSGTLSREWNFGTINNDYSYQINPSFTYNNSNTYLVKLISTSNYGCKDTISKTVTVYPKPRSKFSINKTIQCINENNFLFTDTTNISYGTFSRKWNFGNGDNDTSTLAVINKVYDNATSYSVKLITTSNFGCKDSITNTVLVNPKPNVGFIINSAAQCIAGNNFVLTDTSNVLYGTTTRKWNLGNGNNDTSTLVTINKSYSVANSYLVKLIAISNNNCTDSITKTIIVDSKPNIGFSINNPSQCENGNNFSFIDTSSVSSGNLTRKWNFGGGINDTSLLVNPNKIYSTANTYSIKLIVNNTGCNDSITKTIIVNPKPTVNFIAPTQACINNTTNSFNLMNISSINVGNLNYYWQFSDNTSSSAFNPIKIISDTGNFWVKLIAISDNNCKDSITKTIMVNLKPNTGFSINNPSQCENGNNFSFNDTSTITSGNLTRKWNFGNGVNDTSLLANPSKIYSTANIYSVKLVSISNNGCKDSVTKTVIVNSKPVVNFAAPKLFCLSNSNTSFILSNNSTINSGKLSYNWKFSDYTGSNLTNPIKTVIDTGNFIAKLIATSDNNCKDSLTRVILVNFRPNTGFTINNPIQCLNGNNFLFTDTTTIKKGTFICKWNLGAGVNDTSTFANPNKTYLNVNSYPVKLVTISKDGCKDSVTKTITVMLKPSANFSINNAFQCLKNNNFIFTNQSTIGFNYLWKFDNGDSSVNISPNYSYTSIGTKAVKLIVSDNNNCKDSITKNIVVNANSIANFTINNDTQNFVGNNFVFTNTSTNSSSQLWNFGDSTSATISNPNKTYSSFGTKIVQLISNNVGNCYDTISKNIFVNAHPTIGNILGNINPTSTINPYSYSVLSQSNIVYNWSIQNGVIQSGQGTNAVSVIWSNKGTGNIFAKITNNYNLSDSTNLTVNITTVGINNLSLDNYLNVYPNPTKTSITITNKTNLTGKKYIITNLVGQTVLSGKLNLDETIINLESLQSGMYLLSIDGMNKQSMKVIKE